MKVLLVSSKYQPDYSGSGLRAHNTYKRLEKKYGLNFDVVSNSINHRWNKVYQYEDKKIYRITSPLIIPKKKSIKRNIYIILSLVWETYFSWIYIRGKINNYDLLHTFGNTWTIGFLTWYFSINRKPIIRELCNEMNNPFYPVKFKQIFIKIFSKKNTMMVALSKKLEKTTNGYKTNVWTRPNPVQGEFNIDLKNKYILRSEKTKFKRNDIVLLCVANFIRGKNQKFLLQIIKRLPKKYKLILVGPVKEEGRLYFDEIRSEIVRFKLENRVQIINQFVKNIDKFYKLSDVFLFPSLTEALGTPILEAQACGIPVIANHLKDVVEDLIDCSKGGYYLNLNVEKWIEKIDEAVKISKNKLLENSIYIKSICSHEVIDKNYINKMKNLIKKNA